MIISIDHVWDKVTCKCNGQRLETKTMKLENAFINDMPTIEENYGVYTFTTIKDSRIIRGWCPFVFCGSAVSTYVLIWGGVVIRTYVRCY